MPNYEYLNINNNKIAYRYYKRSKKTVIFIHGLKSNMNGKKSIYLNQYCRKKNYSYLCFDFRGHGKSNGKFTDFGISDWYEDLNKLINFLKIANPILIGSSMGGWVAMLYSLKNPKKIQKLIGIAPAPDFTTDLLWKELNETDKKKIKSNKIVRKKINKEFYYYYSPQLFKNSRKCLIRNMNKKFNGEAIFFHGSLDHTVPYKYNDKFLKKKNFPQLLYITIKNADHSMSDSYSLKTISKFI